MPPSPDEASPRSAYEDVRDTPSLRRLLQTARAWGVRPSEFIAWDEDDRELALALHDYESDACPHCGGQLSVTTTREAEERFVPGPPIRCHRCTALAQAAEIHKAKYHPHAVLHTVRDRALEPDQQDTTGDTGEVGHAEESNEPEASGDPAED